MQKTLLLPLLTFCFFISAKAYWQQECNYNIQVQLNDSLHTLSANLQLEYINHSPDTLRQLYFHLWPNGYKNSKTALAKQLLQQEKNFLYFEEEKYLGYIDSLNFKVNGEKVNWTLTEQHADIAIITLAKPLLPQQKIVITTPFKVKLPEGNVSRLGHDGQSYQITQWYPKPAVYDSEGWHPFPYLDQGEFYSEFGTFDVKITLPENYIVGATGELVGESAESELDFLSQKAKKTAEDFKNGTLDNQSNEFPNSSDKLKTLHFHQEKVHDFAWFADKRWLVQKGVLTLPKSKNKVTTWTYFLPSNALLWKNSNEYVQNGILHYSKFVGEYPYKNCTAVDGALNAGGGMEYPTITIIGETENKFLLEEVIVHEVGHNWFYGILGNNEREHPWMDEGLNSYLERKYYSENYPNAKLSAMLGSRLQKFLGEDDPAQTDYFYLTYLAYASRRIDQATHLPAPEYVGDQYGAIVYAKSALIFHYLEQYLGSQIMDNALKSYFQKWQFKHPQPQDFRNEIENAAGKKLPWFFDDLLNNNLNLDYALTGVGVNPVTGKFEAAVTNKGKVAGPVSITGFIKKQPIVTLWFEGFSKSAVLEFPEGKYDEVMINYHHDMPDVNPTNNRCKPYSVLGKIEPIEFKFLGSVPKENKSQIFYTPFASYNANDKAQVGFVVYNSLLQEKRLRYVLMPTYGFGSKQVIGSALGIYSAYFKNSKIQQINFSLNYKKYGIETDELIGYYDKIEPKIHLFSGANSKLQHHLQLKYTATQIKEQSIQTLKNEYLTLHYFMDNKKYLYPTQLNWKAQMINGRNYKTSLEIKQEFAINKKGQSVNIRIFGGVFFGPAASDLTHRFRLTAHNGSEGVLESGGKIYNRGMSDYLYDDFYFARYQGPQNFLSQQIYISDGGFRTGLFLGANNSWLSTANITCPTPAKWLSLFLDYGIFPGAGNAVNYAYSSGIQLTLIKNVFEVYFPVFLSQNITDNYSAMGLNKYPQKIKFLFNLSQYQNLWD